MTVIRALAGWAYGSIAAETAGKTELFLALGFDAKNGSAAECSHAASRFLVELGSRHSVVAGAGIAANTAICWPKTAGVRRKIRGARAFGPVEVCPMR